MNRYLLKRPIVHDKSSENVSKKRSSVKSDKSEVGVLSVLKSSNCVTAVPTKSKTILTNTFLNPFSLTPSATSSSATKSSAHSSSRKGHTIKSNLSCSMSQSKSSTSSEKSAEQKLPKKSLSRSSLLIKNAQTKESVEHSLKSTSSSQKRKISSFFTVGEDDTIDDCEKQVDDTWQNVSNINKEEQQKQVIDIDSDVGHKDNFCTEIHFSPRTVTLDDLGSIVLKEKIIDGHSEASSATSEEVITSVSNSIGGNDAKNNVGVEPVELARMPYVIPNALSCKVEQGPASLRCSGVIRNTISWCTSSTKAYSNSPRFLLGLSDSRLASLVACKMHSVAAPDDPVMLMNTPAEVRYGVVPTRKGSVTSMKFDNDGVLCAVGASNGAIRIYDFDEVNFKLQKDLNFNNDVNSESGHLAPPQSFVHPILHFSASGRDISDLIWLPPYFSGGIDCDEAELCVAFTYHCAIHIYDLNTLMRTHCLMPVEGRNGGNVCVACLNSNNAKKRGNCRQILSGGSNGICSYWKLTDDGHNVHVGEQNSIAPSWEVLADPLTTAGPHCAVVSILQSAHDTNTVVTVTKLGVIVQWDIQKLNFQSFCSCPKPTSIRRVVLGESISIPLSSPVIGACFSRELCNTPRRSDSKFTLCVTLNDGSVVSYDLVTGNVVEIVSCPLSTDDYVEDNDFNLPTESSRNTYCPIAFSEFTGKQLGYIGSRSSNHLDIIRLGGSTSNLRDLPREHKFRQQLKLLQDQHLRYADAVSYLEHLRPQSLMGSVGNKYERHISHEMASLCLSSKPLMQRSKKIRHTLQGFVLEACPGNTRIVTSEDLTAYLCATGNENKYDAVDNRTDSSISGMLNGNKSSVIHLTEESDLNQTQCYTINAIFGCEISLDKPYMGPKVMEGSPKTFVRTNLTLKTPPALSSSALRNSIHCRKVKDGKTEPTGLCGEFLAHIPLPSRATAIQPHPLIPLIVVGCLDDSVVVISAESRSSSSEYEANIRKA